MSGDSPDVSAAAMREALSRVLPISPELTEKEEGYFFRTCDLIFPELTFYRGGWFRASRFDQDSVDFKIEAHQGDMRGVETSVNHFDVFADFPYSTNETTCSETVALAGVLTFAWNVWAKLRYGLDITCHQSSSGDGLEREVHLVTFSTVPGGPAVA